MMTGSGAAGEHPAPLSPTSRPRAGGEQGSTRARAPWAVRPAARRATGARASQHAARATGAGWAVGLEHLGQDEQDEHEAGGREGDHGELRVPRASGKGRPGALRRRAASVPERHFGPTDGWTSGAYPARIAATVEAGVRTDT